MSASESDANMMTQDSPQEAFAEERMHEGEDDTDVDEVNAEFVEVEVLVKESSLIGRKELVKEVKKFLRSGVSRRYLTGHFKISDFGGWDMLRTNVDSLLVSQEEEAIRGADLTTAPLKVRVVRLELGGAEVEEIAGGSEEEEVPAAQTLVLPNVGLQGVWESLVYDGPVKRDLLNYAFAMLHLSIRGVDSNIVGCNRSFFESPANYHQLLYFTEWFSSTDLLALERPACAEPSLKNLSSDWAIFSQVGS